MKPLIALLAMAAACGGRPTPPPEKPVPAASATPAEVVVAGKGALEQYRQSWEVKSFEALAPLYAHDLDVVVVHQGTAYQGWTAVEARLKELLAGAADIHVYTDEVAVTALGQGGAAVSASLKREVSDGVTAVTEKGQLTLTLRRDGERWVIVAEHFSYPVR